MEWEPLDLGALDEPGRRAWHDLHAAIDLEEEPDVPVDPFEHRLLVALRLAPEVTRQRWAVWSDDRTRLLGEAVLTTRDVPDNRHLGDADVRIAPEVRRRGLGRRALGHLAAAAAADGRTKLWAYGLQGSPGVLFNQAVGARPVMVERRSRVLTADIDRALLEGWVARAAERATDYELVTWLTPTPDEHLERYVEVMHAMNTAPMGESDWEPEVFTPDMVRGWEARAEALGHVALVVAARHVPTGAFAGLSDIQLQPTGRAAFAHQGNTGVDPAHRDKGLGRWMKAANALRLLDEHPEVTMLDTWNNDDNRPMLNINEAMGFRPWQLYETYQLDVEVAAAAAAAA